MADRSFGRSSGNADRADQPSEVKGDLVEIPGGQVAEQSPAVEPKLRRPRQWHGDNHTHNYGSGRGSFTPDDSLLREYHPGF